MSKPKRKRPVCGFSLDYKVKQDLDQASRLSHVPRSQIVENAVKSYLYHFRKEEER
jgi:metal-responsive CopG/Arc/MetJ family transcriptional regulator